MLRGARQAVAMALRLQGLLLRKRWPQGWGGGLRGALLQQLLL